jgi:hypothetical protein
MAQCAPPRLERTIVVYAIAMVDQWPAAQKQVFWNNTAKGEVTCRSLDQ